VSPRARAPFDDCSAVRVGVLALEAGLVHVSMSVRLDVSVVRVLMLDMVVLMR
jgi:hypothetical protein